MHQPLGQTSLLALALLTGAHLSSRPAHANKSTNEEILNVELKKIKSLIQDGKLSEAVRNLDSIKAKSESSSTYYFLKGRAMQELKKNTEALSNYTISIFLDKNNINARINRALTYGALGDINGALKELDEAALIDPKNPVIPMNRGVTLAGLNRPQEAIREFDRAIRINRRYSDAYRNRGIARHFLKDLPGACRDWRQASSYGDDEAYDWVKFYCITQPAGGAKPPRK